MSRLSILTGAALYGALLASPAPVAAQSLLTWPGDQLNPFETGVLRTHPVTFVMGAQAFADKVCGFVPTEAGTRAFMAAHGVMDNPFDNPVLRGEAERVMVFLLRAPDRQVMCALVWRDFGPGNGHILPLIGRPGDPA